MLLQTNVSCYILEKEEQRKDSLKQKLKEMHCEELYNIFENTDCRAEDVFSLDNDALKEFRISIQQRENVLEKIKKGVKVAGI